YYPYTLNFAATLCFIGITWYGDYRRRASAAEVIAATVLVSWITFLIPYVTVVSISPNSLQAAALALPLLLVGAVLHRVFVPHVRHRPLAEHPWMRQAMLSLSVSALGVIVGWMLAWY
ncbi:MAG: hypothetical protein ABI877_15550, partial [Gemmatimonadaceae bacterium]